MLLKFLITIFVVSTYVSHHHAKYLKNNEESATDVGVVNDITSLQDSIYQEFSLDFYADETDDEQLISCTDGLLFRPDSMSFVDSPVSIPKIMEFTIHNMFDFEVHILSIVSTNTQFYPVMFQPQTIPIKQYSVFHILYLPKNLESVHTMLTISTSHGDFEYSIYGQSVKNPYGLHPLVNNKVLRSNLDAFEVPVVIFNPFQDTLNIREVYTTEEFLGLRGALLRNDNSSPNADDNVNTLTADAVWIVPPGSEKEVITLSFAATLDPGFHHGYVHLKTDHDDMVLAVEVEVLAGGVHAVPEALQFGVLTSTTERKSLDLWLVNNEEESAEVVSIELQTPDEQMQLIWSNSRVLPSQSETLVASVVYTTSSRGEFNNKLLVYTNSSKMSSSLVEVPTSVTVLQGGVGFRVPEAVFAVPTRNAMSSGADGDLDRREDETAGVVVRRLTLINYFDVAVALNSVTMSTCIDLFEVDPPVEVDDVAQGLEEWSSAVTVRFIKELAVLRAINFPDYLPKMCWLDVSTNISSHRIPLHVIDGTLTLQYMDANLVEIVDVIATVDQHNYHSEHHVDLGAISAAEPRLLRVVLSNSNPLEIPLELASSTHDVCICAESSWPVGLGDEEAAARHMATVSARPDFEATSSQEDLVKCSCERGNSKNESVPAPSWQTKAGYNSMLSISLHNLSPISECACAEDLLNGMGCASECVEKATVILQTPHQSIIFNVFFSIAQGKLTTMVDTADVSRGGVFVAGLNTPLTLLTESTFPDVLQDLSVAATSSQYALVLDNVYALSSSGDGAAADDVKRWNTLVFFVDCGHANSIYNSVFHCLSRPMIARQLFSQPRNFDNILSHLERLADSDSGKALPAAPDTLHREVRLLKTLWTAAYPEGVTLPEMDIVVQSAQTHHRYKICNASLESPLQAMPDHYRILLPPIRAGESVLFYIEMYNPFALPVSFSLASRNNLLISEATDLDSGAQDTSSRMLVSSPCRCVQEMSRESDSDHCDGDCASFDSTAGKSYFKLVNGAVADVVATRSFNYSRKSFASQHSNGEFVFHAQSHTMESKWVAPSLSSVLVGPILLHWSSLSLSCDNVSECLSTSPLFIRNNFTGVDRLNCVASLGSAQFVVSELDSFERMARFAKNSGRWETTPMPVEKLSQTFAMRVSNVGEVAAIVTDVIWNQKSCADRTQTLRSALFGTTYSATHDSVCSQLPLDVPAGSSVVIPIESFQSCHFHRRKMTVYLSIVIQTSAHGPSDSAREQYVRVDITTPLLFSSQLDEFCANQPPGRAGWLVLKLMSAMVTVVFMFQMVLKSLRLLVKWNKYQCALESRSICFSEMLHKSPSLAVLEFVLGVARQRHGSLHSDHLSYPKPPLPKSNRKGKLQLGSCSSAPKLVGSGGGLCSEWSNSADLALASVNRKMSTVSGIDLADVVCALQQEMLDPTGYMKCLHLLPSLGGHLGSMYPSESQAATLTVLPTAASETPTLSHHDETIHLVGYLRAATDDDMAVAALSKKGAAPVTPLLMVDTVVFTPRDASGKHAVESDTILPKEILHQSEESKKQIDHSTCTVESFHRMVIPESSTSLSADAADDSHLFRYSEKLLGESGTVAEQEWWVPLSVTCDGAAVEHGDTTSQRNSWLPHVATAWNGSSERHVKCNKKAHELLWTALDDMPCDSQDNVHEVSESSALYSRSPQKEIFHEHRSEQLSENSDIAQQSDHFFWSHPTHPLSLQLSPTVSRGFGSIFRGGSMNMPPPLILSAEHAFLSSEFPDSLLSHTMSADMYSDDGEWDETLLDTHAWVQDLVLDVTTEDEDYARHLHSGADAKEETLKTLTERGMWEAQQWRAMNLNSTQHVEEQTGEMAPLNAFFGPSTFFDGGMSDGELLEEQDSEQF